MFLCVTGDRLYLTYSKCIVKIITTQRCSFVPVHPIGTLLFLGFCRLLFGGCRSSIRRLGAASLALFDLLLLLLLLGSIRGGILGRRCCLPARPVDVFLLVLKVGFRQVPVLIDRVHLRHGVPRLCQAAEFVRDGFHFQVVRLGRRSFFSIGCRCC